MTKKITPEDSTMIYRGPCHVAAFLMLLIVPWLLPAQQRAPESLKPANGILNQEVGWFNSVRELSDGRVLLWTMPGMQFSVADLSTGKVQLLPESVQGRFYPLRGDSTLVDENLLARWQFIIGTHLLAAVGHDKLPLGREWWLQGVDTLGSLVARWSRQLPPGDSAPVLLFSRATAHGDTIGRLAEEPHLGRAGDPRPLYQPQSEAVFMAMDGWIAVVRINPYRVDWRAPSGTWNRGRPIPNGETVMNDTEKRAYMKRLSGDGSPKSPETIKNWPATIPAVSSLPVSRMTSDGNMLVQRNSTSAFPGTMYDVINRRGEVERQVMLPANESILGFGPRSVYVAVTEKPGAAAHLERHPWP